MPVQLKIRLNHPFNFRVANEPQPAAPYISIEHPRIRLIYRYGLEASLLHKGRLLLSRKDDVETSISKLCCQQQWPTDMGKSVRIWEDQDASIV